ncbi:hypothetical protein FA95DRAFT_232602 [Auriscalpium vulgare]|uniref:Uncharacterized protein n=1 Tax=Auriscalpium vulgare TaxID=40419 RepID=A0ACB8S4Z4_9AGAM|nr:hypothetical protein FA95DRAFT_232602 [Auriscalpium vulgare]
MASIHTNDSSPSHLVCAVESDSSALTSTPCLPTDLWLIIFSLATASIRSPIRSVPPQSRWNATAVAISHVCGRWRSIIIDMPWLWTFIFFNGVNGSTPAQKHRVATHAKRARNSPLTLAAVFPKLTDCVGIDHPRMHASNIFVDISTFLPLAATVLVFTVEPFAADLFSAQLNAITLSRPLPLLRNVTVQVVSSSQPTITPRYAEPLLLQTSQDSIKLQSCSLIRTAVSWGRTNLRSLTRLTLGGFSNEDKPSPAQLRRVLNACRMTLICLELQGDVVPLVIAAPGMGGARLQVPRRAPRSSRAFSTFQVEEEASRGDVFNIADFPELIDEDCASEQGEDTSQGDFASDADEEDMELLQDTLETIGIVTPSPSDYEAIHFPSLVELHICFTHSLEGLALLRLFEAPALERFRFDDLRNGSARPTNFCNLAFKHLVEEGPIPFHNLTHLHLEGIQYKSASALPQQLYRQCTRLKTLAVVNCHNMLIAPVIICRSADFGSFEDHTQAAVCPVGLERMYVQAASFANIRQSLSANVRWAKHNGYKILPATELTIAFSRHNLSSGVPIKPSWILKRGLAKQVVIIQRGRHILRIDDTGLL